MLTSRMDGVEALQDVRGFREQCQVRLDQCATGLLELDARMRAQEGSHDESEHENDAENRQTSENRSRYRRTVQQRRTTRAMSGVPP